jgi:superfamily II DNA or RNA helicase
MRAVQQLQASCQPSFAAGDMVTARDGVWRVAAIEAYQSCAAVTLAPVDRGGERRTLLHPFDVIEARYREPTPRVVSMRRWCHGLRTLMAGAQPRDALWSAAAAAVELWPYQLEPALAVVRGLSGRLLLADEVGLGKTIQAGFVLAELRARASLERALIVVPVGLRDQWAEELRERFDLDVTVADAAWLRRAVSGLPRGVNPWAAPGLYLCSLDFIKRAEALQALERLVWDALVIDEAHRAAAGTDRGGAAARLARRARRVVLVTATPHAGEDVAFSWLCGLGALPDEPDQAVTMFRRTRAQVGVAVDRRVHLLRVRITAAERHMHVLLDRYAREVLRENQRGDARLALTILKKRALSSPSSLAHSAVRRAELLAGLAADSPSQIPLPFSDDAFDQTDEDLPSDTHLGAPGLASAARERTWLGAIANAARTAAAAESKVCALVRLVRRAHEPIIVFTEYRDTLDRLAAALRAVAPTAILHGGLTAADRRAALSRFGTREARVLLATDVAGEGLNLQGMSRAVVNVELPWNPMRLEQRIGRVDRIGQRRRVHAINFLAAGTGEQDVLARLAARLERARRGLGTVADAIGPVTEDDIAAAMIGAAPQASNAEAECVTAASRVDLQHEALVEAQRAETERMWRRGRARAGPNDRRNLERRMPWVVMRRYSRLPFLPSSPSSPHSIWIFRTTLVDGRGRQVETGLVPLASPFEMHAMGPSARVRAAVERVLHSSGEALVAAARRQAAVRLAAVHGDYTRSVLRERSRELAMLAAEGAATPDPVQPALFDRRALDAHRAVERIRDGLIRELETRAAALDDAIDLRIGAIEPALVLVLCR